MLVDMAHEEHPDLPEPLEREMVRESMGVVAQVSLRCFLCSGFLFWS